MVEFTLATRQDYRVMEKVGVLALTKEGCWGCASLTTAAEVLCQTR